MSRTSTLKTLSSSKRDLKASVLDACCTSFLCLSIGLHASIFLRIVGNPMCHTYVPSCLLAQGEDLILHGARDRIGFNKDHYPLEDHGRNLYLLLILLFSICPIFICRLDQASC
jgi:hypothetical protein